MSTAEALWQDEPLTNNAEYPAEPGVDQLELATRGVAGVVHLWHYRDLVSVRSAREDEKAFVELMNDYQGLLRLIASRYYVRGSEFDDNLQEARIGFIKAVRDYDYEKGPFAAFVRLCVTRQLITTVTTANRLKHQPLNTAISFEHTPSQVESEHVIFGDTLADAKPEVAELVISTEKLDGLVNMLATSLSPLESDALRLFLDGSSYEDMAVELGTDTKAIDNALQRVKRKILIHDKSYESQAA